MSTDRHVTIVEVDVTQAVSAEAKLAAAQQARVAAQRQLAAVLDAAEKARIAALQQSENLAKQAAGARREETRLARQAVAAAREQEQAAKSAAAEERKRAEASNQAAERAAKISFTGLASQVGSIVTGFQSLISIGQQAIAVMDKLATDSITAQNVSQNLQVPIDGARQAFKGYVEDVELARIANMAFELGVIETGDDLTALAAGVQAKAEKLGVSSTQLFENAVTGIGRQSALILDNLGIILNQAKAQEIYAKSLGITVSKLSAYQKSQAFAKAATIEISKAGKDATKTTDGLAQSYQRATVMVSNFRSSMLGFDDTIGKTREAMRQLSDAELRSITQTDTYGAAVVESNEALARYGVTLEDVKKIGDPISLAQAEMQRRVAAGLEFERKQIEENNNVRARGLQGWAKDTEHQIELQSILGAEESHLIQLKIDALELEREASVILGNKTDEDRARTHEIEKQLELERARLGMAQLEESKPKRGGGRRRDPNEALDRETEATLRLLDARTQLYEAEHRNERNLADAAAQRFYLIELAREELEIRERALDQRKIKGPEETAKAEAEALAIATERRLLDLDAQELVNDEARRAAEERLAAMDREIERYNAVGIATGLLEKRREEAHLAFVTQFGTEQEILDTAASNALSDLERREGWRVDTAEKELDAFEREVDLVKARGRVYYDEADERLSLQIKIADAEGNDDKRRQLYHQREVLRIEERKAKFARAQQATNSLIGASAGLAEAVANATMKNEARREKFVLRVRGVEAVARGAAETVEAAAAYAALNVPQAVLHTIAAATAFATGIPMIAGVVPSGGSAGGGGAVGGGGEGSAISTKYERGGDYESPTVPPSAEELVRLRGGSSATTQTTESKGGGTVINIGNFIAGDSGTILQDMEKKTAKQWGSR